MPARYRLLALITSSLLIAFTDARAASVMVMPASATISPGQSFLFSAAIVGAGNTGVTWSMSPALGTISNGYYTAPATVTTPQTVMLTASSLGNAGMSGTAVITLMPAGAGAPSVASSGSGVSLTPSTASLSAGQAAMFTFNGASGATWSLSPLVGTISNGFYQAPSTLSSSQMVTVTAVSTSDPTQRATATVSLVASGSGASSGGFVYIMPSSASLTAGQVARFSSGVSGGVNAGVSWSLSPAMGIISNGYYTAPSNIPFSQTVTLTATSLANPTLSNSVPIFLIGNSPGGAPAALPNPPSTPSSPLAPASLSLAPMSISLLPLQNAQFTVSSTGGLSTSVSWSLVPSIGSISNGVYGAPASVSTQTMVTVIATSMFDATKTASAAVMLQPNAAGSVSVSLTPASVTMTSGQVAQFSAAVSGTSNTGVTWSMSPSLGSLSNGTYTSPVVTSQQAVSITATSVADPTKSASASVMLIPVTIALAPATISLAAGKSAQFTASVTGASNTSVTWSISPAVGSISNGLYLAPSTVSAVQNVTVTATSVADPTKLAQATVSLTPTSSPASIAVSPAQASLSASQTQQFSALVSGGLGGGGAVSVTWSISPAVGSITQSGLYTAPSSVSAQQNIIVTATGSGTSNSAVVTLNPAAQTPAPSPAPSQPQTTTAQLPVEVMGAAGTTVPVSVNIPQGSNITGPLQLWLQIHGLKYETEASVQFNGGAWIPINTSTVTLQGYAAAVGGIGGGFATLQLTLNIPSGAIVQGQNTITFQFLGTDGITSGYRIINLNILSGGSQLVASSNFTNDDPSQWQPPLNDASDIQAGQSLWSTASLTVPGGSAGGVGGAGSIVAHCSDCHSIDGRDLKYFNYSNYSIRTRSMFHGLTQQQGDQIASYIRSLNTPAPSGGRPWNPPYQPGPGMDSQPVTNWAAGAGIDAVLGHDADMLPYLMPGGSNANLALNGYLNARETPLALQLLDWNRWLPTVSPMDAYGSQFAPITATYFDIRSKLQPNNPTAYANTLGELYSWMTNLTTLDQVGIPPNVPISPLWNDGSIARRIYSDRQWGMVKLWELNQEFGLEGMAQSSIGPQSAAHAWNTNEAFLTSPNISRIPINPGIGNGTAAAHGYLSFIWYHLQLILNDGNGNAQGTFPIDWGYAIAYPTNTLTWNGATSTPYMGTAGLTLEWFAKALQSANGPGGPGPSGGPGDPQDSQPYFLVQFPSVPSVWSEVSPAQMVQLMNTWLGVWFSAIQTYSPTTMYNVMATPTFSSSAPGSFTGDLAFSLPILRYEGADSNLLNQIANWASGLWPTFNWAGALGETCTTGNEGFVACQ
jgi:hypothetical protein